MKLSVGAPLAVSGSTSVKAMERLVILLGSRSSNGMMPATIASVIQMDVMQNEPT